MEDEYLAFEVHSAGRPKGQFLGVFDGHGGRSVARYVKENLKGAFLENVTGPNVSSSDSFGDDYYIDAVKKSLRKLDDAVMGEKAWMTEGSTANIVYIYDVESSTDKTQKSIVCINVGDSRSVLARGK
jgi:protein phosphatase 2C family protein 2/3